MRARSVDPNLKFAKASEKVLRDAWGARAGIPSMAKKGGVSRMFKPDEQGMSWCEQCDQRVTKGRATACGDGFCPMRLASAAR